MQILVAYLDPGMGMFAAQALMAALLGSAFFFRDMLTGVFRIFKRTKEESSPDGGSDSHEGLQ